MNSRTTRRQFARFGAAASIAAFLPRGVFSQGSTNKKAVIHAGDEIATVRPDLHGHFLEHLGSATYGGLWVGKNSPIPNVNGFRKAAVDYLKELGVPVLRWPGGCFADDYHWRDGIGSKRPKSVNIHWGNYTEDNSFGTHEFLELCKLINSEPYLAANVGSGTPQEMRDWIEYCNFPSGSTLSDERAANGAREPFKVRYWGVGNELWGCGGNYRAEGAAAEFRRFATYAREFGGVRPYLIGCGPNGNDARWTRGFMDTLVGSRQPDGYSMHFYSNSQVRPLEFTPEAMNAQLNSFPRVEQSIIQQRALLDGYDPQRRVGLLLDEWGVWDRMTADEERRNGKLWQQASMRSAIAAALGLNLFNRQADKLYMCNIAQIMNVLQSVLLTEGPEGKVCVRTTNYWAFMLFKAHRAKMAVRVETDGPKLYDYGRTGRNAPPDPQPDLSLSASKLGGEMVVTLVNPRHDVAMNVECTIHGATARSGRAEILHSTGMNAFNSFEEPDRITVKPYQVAVESGRLRVTLPATSIVTARLPIS